MTASSPSSTLDPYDVQPPFWQRHSERIVPLVVFVYTALLSVLAFPPFNAPEVAYAFAVPAVLWAYRRPNFKLYAAVTLGAHVVAWTIVLSWLHHVTWFGLFLLGPFMGLWIGSWFLAVWWLAPRLPGRPTLLRFLGVFGLAALWVVIEWTRTWVLSGFPWLPLAASQWQRQSILQIAAFTGAGGISFVLITMNLAFAAYAHRLVFERAVGLNRRSQEFLMALFLLLVCLTIHVQETVNRPGFTGPFARVGFVQPHIPQSLKWDPASAGAILDTLEKTTMTAAARKPDLILWPEAVTPLAVRDGDRVQQWTESLTAEAGAPLVLGSIGFETVGGRELWTNGAFVVDPVTGLQTRSYAKRRLVPFGEFVPLRPLLGWLGKFVEIGGDFTPGEDASPLIVSTRAGVFSLGPLICYEDVFPSLARRSVLSGVDALVVLTNNGWFGEGGAAYQHAAHSVLRAIETRRPVLRCGNGGWSGWIDEFGSIRAVVQAVTPEGAAGASRRFISTRPSDTGTIYFRGAATVDVTRDQRWIGKNSFYVEHGNWFILVCAGIVGVAYLTMRRIPPQQGGAR